MMDTTGLGWSELKAIIVTNNRNVKEKYEQNYEVDFIEGSALEVLNRVRNQVHKGHGILSHPLSGSIKPNESPYKTVLLSCCRGALDENSLLIIEKSINTFEKFIQTKKVPLWTDSILADFRVIDCALIDGAIESMRQFG